MAQAAAIVTFILCSIVFDFLRVPRVFKDLGNWAGRNR